ncbi:hypothetical protein ACFXPZ_13835 [Streptomyces sp. NPDC059101]|uniref:hypothetical protein n=1 Tax=Streptomyces sp. NPDC059101 TaxID=3346728 RepID=UPI0036AE2AEE
MTEGLSGGGTSYLIHRFQVPAPRLCAGPGASRAVLERDDLQGQRAAVAQRHEVVMLPVDGAGQEHVGQAVVEVSADQRYASEQGDRPVRD